uniref:Translation initiation factor eIF2B subunit alpha n=1 Tax=Timspurckia oligopyrenoides TaxID=708627 RepID=A0A7S1ETG8_9RHOD|mmetsp:Transcript_61/g.98  ORF Transcript_61/g.98 Transcript_61/m.98 type:complete len:326 (+) Transcript_61:42-1019(+)
MEEGSEVKKDEMVSVGMNVTEEFLAGLNRGEKIAASAVRVLSDVVRKSSAGTLMELEHDIRKASDQMQNSVSAAALSLKAVCELFLVFVTRVSLDSKRSFEQCRQELIARGEKFVESTEICVHTIAKTAARFVRDSSTILTHGNSKLVSTILERAAVQDGKSFHVYVTETRPQGDGFKVAARLRKQNIPVTMILDSAVGAIMEKVDMVLVGAEAVVENGGLVNRVGTFLLAMAAKTFNKPFYVASESYKFARLYPLSQKELPSVPAIKNGNGWDAMIPEVQSDSEAQFENITSDFTPASYITLLFSDVGVLTPAAVSDELIRLYI